MTGDAQKIENENKTDIKWDRKGARAWETEEEELRYNLKTAYSYQGIENESLKRKFDAVNEHVGGKGDFWSRPTFNKWLGRKKCRQLKSQQIEALISYIESVSHLGNDDVVGSSTEDDEGVVEEELAHNPFF